MAQFFQKKAQTEVLYAMEKILQMVRIYFNFLAHVLVNACTLKKRLYGRTMIRGKSNGETAIDLYSRTTIEINDVDRPTRRH